MSHALRLASLLGAAFGGFMLAAVAHYPGGTWNDAATTGFSWTSNYWCDLLHPVALNGAENAVSAQFASYGLLCLGASIGPFFVGLPAAFPHARDRCHDTRYATRVGWVRALGGVGGFGALASPLVPSHTFGARAHAIIMLLTALPLGVAAILSVHELRRTAHRRGTWLCRAAATTLVLTVVAAGMLAHQRATGTPHSPWLPFVSKLTSLAMLVWIEVTAASVARQWRGGVARCERPPSYTQRDAVLELPTRHRQ